jgi:Lar family restriction alleviation protein
MSKDDLEKCPFCGGNAQVGSRQSTVDSEVLFRVLCERCLGSSDWYRARIWAIQYWNRRTPLSAATTPQGKDE